MLARGTTATLSRHKENHRRVPVGNRHDSATGAVDPKINHLAPCRGSYFVHPSGMGRVCEYGRRNHSTHGRRDRHRGRNGTGTDSPILRVHAKNLLKPDGVRGLGHSHPDPTKSPRCDAHHRILLQVMKSFNSRLPSRSTRHPRGCLSTRGDPEHRPSRVRDHLCPASRIDHEVKPILPNEIDDHRHGWITTAR